MKKALFLVVLALASLSAEAGFYTVSGKITTLFVRNSPFTLPAPADGVLIGFSPGFAVPAGTTNIPYCMSNGTSFAGGIPKADPANPGAANPLYRELLNAATLAAALDKNVNIYLHDSLCYGVFYPTIIGIDVLP